MTNNITYGAVFSIIKYSMCEFRLHDTHKQLIKFLE